MLPISPRSFLVWSLRLSVMSLRDHNCICNMTQALMLNNIRQDPETKQQTATDGVSNVISRGNELMKCSEKRGKATWKKGSEKVVWKGPSAADCTISVDMSGLTKVNNVHESKCAKAMVFVGRMTAPVRSSHQSWHRSCLSVLEGWPEITQVARHRGNCSFDYCHAD